MLLRYRTSLEGAVGEPPVPRKERVGVLDTLQANETPISAEMLAHLSRLSGVPPARASRLVGALRTNACEVRRGDLRAGCALSALMGWHNHDCAPNASATIGPEGALVMTALRDVAAGDEVLISYVDARLPLDERRRTLAEHYGFDCRCARCHDEQRKLLKAKIRAR